MRHAPPRRVLRCLTSSTTSRPGRRGLRDWFAQAGDPAAGYTAATTRSTFAPRYSTFRWLLEPMLAATGFEVTDVSYERRLYGAYTYVKTANG